MWRTVATGLLVVGAVIVAGQVGMVHLPAPAALRRIAELHERLEFQQRTCRATTAQTTADLERARVRADWLQVTVGQVEQENAELRSELEALQARSAALELSRSQLRGEVDDLAGELREAPPFLDVELVSGERVGELVAVAHNPGPREVDVLEVWGRLWLDGEPVGRVSSVDGTEIAPGAEADLFVYALAPAAAGLVLSGEGRLTASLCFAYERVRDPEPGTWVDVYGFEYDLEARSRMLRRDSRAFADGDCDPDTDLGP